MSRRLADVFAAAKSENRAALIGYLPAGFPDRDTCVDLISTMVESGVDAIEVGLPYSDPLMDGAVIQEAVERALIGGTTTDVVLDTVRRVTKAGAVAVVMSYWNPIERYGVQRFAVVSSTSGFVYAASTMGVTGARTSVSTGAGDLVARARRQTALPIAVGLGVSTGEQAAQVATYADGVIVGSAFIRRILEATDSKAARESVAALAREMAEGVRA